MKTLNSLIIGFALVLCIFFLLTPVTEAGEKQSISLPAGIVVPFAGPPENVPDGWLLCDGLAVSSVDYPELFAAIGYAHGDGGDALDPTSFNLPDYRGSFLRGVDAGAGRDPDSLDRLEMAPGGNTGDSVGAVQEDATAMPTTTFATVKAGEHIHGIVRAGEHTHDIEGVADHSHGIGDILRPGTGKDGGDEDSRRRRKYRGGEKSLDQQTDPAGAHTHLMNAAGVHIHSMNAAGVHVHEVTGGDSETRPVNAYVNFIIKSRTETVTVHIKTRDRDD